jgi:hypothetical protein
VDVDILHDQADQMPKYEPVHKIGWRKAFNLFRIFFYDNYVLVPKCAASQNRLPQWKYRVLIKHECLAPSYILLEVGTEELPASFVDEAIKQWRSRIPKA